MQLTENQFAFVAALRSKKHTPVQLQQKFNSVPDAEKFHAILSVFTESNVYADQQSAGKLLVDYKPQCDDSLTEILTSIAPTWNLSVEELPFYLSDVFGAQVVATSAIMLSEEMAENSTERKALETVAWWLKRRVKNGG